MEVGTTFGLALPGFEKQKCFVLVFFFKKVAFLSVHYPFR
jgi:hypothetical protein